MRRGDLVMTLEPVRVADERPDYSAKYVRFVLVPAHAEAYMAAHEAYDPSAASNELQRLFREFKTLPPRHDCTCHPGHCDECGRVQKYLVVPSLVTTSRTSPVHAPMPSVLVLDLEMAMAVLGRRRATPDRIARFLSEGN